MILKQILAGSARAGSLNAFCEAERTQRVRFDIALRKRKAGKNK